MQVTISTNLRLLRSAIIGMLFIQDLIGEFLTSEDDENTGNITVSYNLIPKEYYASNTNALLQEIQDDTILELRALLVDFQDLIFPDDYIIIRGIVKLQDLFDKEPNLTWSKKYK